MISERCWNVLQPVQVLTGADHERRYVMSLKIIRVVKLLSYQRS